MLLVSSKGEEYHEIKWLLFPTEDILGKNIWAQKSSGWKPPTNMKHWAQHAFLEPCVDWYRWGPLLCISSFLHGNLVVMKPFLPHKLHPDFDRAPSQGIQSPHNLWHRLAKDQPSSGLEMGVLWHTDVYRMIEVGVHQVTKNYVGGGTAYLYEYLTERIHTCHLWRTCMYIYIYISLVYLWYRHSIKQWFVYVSGRED